ncbi:MAG: uroporphyrinogen decarboxylase family protein [Sphaerochaetaceae bacterium]|nr:uroporphyrinogen decarboxylase family protein [Sphaerochaetaceae bacterium]MDD4007316.1 uroporphyrinogen decarboxylase family protein [Sphaerochaetaceae bacterium]
MTPKERVYSRLKSGSVDIIPNFSIVMLFAAYHAGIPYDVFCSDYRALVKAQTLTAKDFGLDILSSMSDPFRETYDYGGPVRFVDDNLPACDGATFSDLDSWNTKLKHWDPFQSTRILDRIKAIELFRKENGEEYPILGWVEGPFAEFCDLATISEGMMMLYDSEDEINSCLDFITDQQISVALAQVESGADIIGMGDAAASLISNDMYCNLIQKREERIIKAVQDAGAICKLHICGDINHILPAVIDTGAKIVDIDYMVDFDNAMALAKGRCSICGHIEPAGVILRGNPSEIKGWVDFCVEHGNADSIVSSGCEVPKSTPPENLMAIHDRLVEIGPKQGR